MSLVIFGIFVGMLIMLGMDNLRRNAGAAGMWLGLAGVLLLVAYFSLRGKREE